MKINYKKFSKHAEKVTKNACKSRPILKGIHHDDKGTLSVTDSFRLYQARNVNAPRNVVLDGVTGEEIEGKFPDVERLLPDPEEGELLYDYDTKRLLATLKAMQHAGRVDGTKRDAIYLDLDGNTIRLGVDEGTPITFEYKLHSDDPTNERRMRFSLMLFLEAVEMFADMGIEELEIRYYGANRPFTIEPVRSDDLTALIVPIRRY